MRAIIALLIFVLPASAEELLECKNERKSSLYAVIAKTRAGPVLKFRNSSGFEYDFTVTVNSTHFIGYEKQRLKISFELDRVSGRLEWREYIVKASAPAFAERCDGKITFDECAKKVRAEDATDCVFVDQKHPECPQFRIGGTLLASTIYMCQPAKPKF
jgi:hypothetical protein